MYNTVSRPATGAARFPFLHGGSGGQSPPANFKKFSVDIPPFVFLDFEIFKKLPVDKI